MGGLTKVEMNEGLWDKLPELTPMFGYYQQFESPGAWDWYIRGCPDGEAVYLPGLLYKLADGSGAFTWAD